MKDQRLEIKDIVKHIDDATLGTLNVPEFQRKFVWKPSKTKDLVDSLWRGYPIGTLLLWESSYSSPRSALGTQSQKQWIIDGQQRVTSLALLFGKKPYWWEDVRDWNQYFEKYDVLVNISRDKDSLEFGLPNPVRRKSDEWISVRKILTLDNEGLSRLAQDIATKMGDVNRLFAEVHAKLQSVKEIEDFKIYEIIVDHELEDVAEIFNRLNSAGTKIRESDIIRALIAAKQPGWVRDELDPFLRDLMEKGFELDPAILIRTFAIIGEGSARLKDIPEDFWERSREFDERWQTTKEAISFVIRNFFQYGILNSELLPAHNVLIPMFVLRARFPNDFIFNKAFYWFLLATRDGRYSGSALTILDQDAKKINSSISFDNAINNLIEPLKASPTFSVDDYFEEYTDKFLRLILYILAFKNEAKDWIYQDIRIGYDRTDNEINEGFKPEWHHFFPRKILKDRFEQSEINALANIAILNEKANRVFKSKEPRKYLKEHDVKDERLREQLIPIDENFKQIDKYKEFLQLRASNLANVSTEFMKELRRG